VDDVPHRLEPEQRNIEDGPVNVSEIVVKVGRRWSFWQEGYPAIMISDTAIFRNPNYHKLSDTPEKLNYEPMARVVLGITKLVKHLGG